MEYDLNEFIAALHTFGPETRTYAWNEGGELRLFPYPLNFREQLILKLAGSDSLPVDDELCSDRANLIVLYADAIIERMQEEPE